MPLNSGSYNVLLLGQQALVDNGVIDANVDPTMIQPIIKLVQDQWLQEIIGTPMYVYLQNAIASNTLLPTDTSLLQMYIEPLMVWYCTYELSFFNTYKIKVKGLEKMSGENSQAASLSEVQAFQNKTKERAENYAQKMLRYMEGNPSLFPAFSQPPIVIGDMAPNFRSAYKPSMYLGNDKRYWGNRDRSNGNSLWSNFW